MRTTVTLDPDAFHAAEAKAAHENVSLGKAISLLILQAIHEERKRPKRSRANAVFESSGGIYTSEQVDAALEEE